jgi:hypothetical protein
MPEVKKESLQESAKSSIHCQNYGVNKYTSGVQWILRGVYIGEWSDINTTGVLVNTIVYAVYMHRKAFDSCLQV